MSFITSSPPASLEAIQDLIGPAFLDSASVDFTYSDVGNTITADVISVGGQTAANVAAGAVLANASTHLDTPGAIVRRASSGATYMRQLILDNETPDIDGVCLHIIGDVDNQTTDIMTVTQGGQEVFSIDSTGNANSNTLTLSGFLASSPDGGADIGAAAGSSRFDLAHFKTKVEVPLVTGGFASAGNLDLSSTSHGTKGFVKVDDGSMLISALDDDFADSVSATDLQGFGITTVVAGSATTGAFLYIVGVDTTVGGLSGGGLAFSSAKGNYTTTDYVDSGATLGDIYYDVSTDGGIDNATSAQVSVAATEDHSATNLGCSYDIQTVINTEASLASRLKINSAGHVELSGNLQVLSNANPSALANAIKLGAVDSSTTSLRTVSLRTEQAVEAGVAIASTNKLLIVINGVEYYLPLTAV